ncbi:alpha/beta hydrolase [Ralstonia solanacearum]|uniref:alpha/beta hydrolase n=1 Tax=Ralstonia solanacearum TaxID=305 RepID=UPI000A754F89|nr:alpha/beta hydrolase [Ralstonia solanacearum]MDB0526825.1 alpha/beta hydrolase [Ralstonia solanacearum]
MPASVPILVPTLIPIKPRAIMLDIQMQSLLQGMQQAGVPDMADLPPQAARQVYSRIMAAAAEPVRAVAIAERIIAGPGGDLALRVYAPRQPDPRRGIVLYLHGGGFVVGTARDYDSVASALCEQSGCVVVQADYRLAPEHPFPAAVEDAWAAACWVAAQAHALGAQPRIAVVGDSAGGNLAAVLALLARDCAGPAIVQQTLIYPVVAARPETTGSYRRYGSGYTLTTRLTHYFHDLYRGGRPIDGDPRLAPLAAPDVSGLPPALVMVAGYDVLRDEGIQYAHRLAQAGTPVTLVEYSGMVHGFIAMAGALEAARQALAQVADAVGRALVG